MSPLSTVSSGDWFYKNFNGGAAPHEGAAPTGSFPAYDAPQVNLETVATSMKFRAATNDVDFSFDGTTVHGSIKPADGLVEFDHTNKKKIWLKGTGTLEVWAWH